MDPVSSQNILLRRFEINHSVTLHSVVYEQLGLQLGVKKILLFPETWTKK